MSQTSKADVLHSGMTNAHILHMAQKTALDSNNILTHCGADVTKGKQPTCNPAAPNQVHFPVKTTGTVPPNSSPAGAKH